MKTKTRLIAALISSILISGPVLAQDDNENQLDFLDKSSDTQKTFQLNESHVKDIAPSNKILIENKNQGQGLKIVKNESVNEKYRAVETFIDPAISAQRNSEISKIEHDLEISKLRMQKKEVEDQIADLEDKQKRRILDVKSQENKAAWEIEKAEIISKFEFKLKQAQDENNYLQKKLSEKNEINGLLNNKIFVTKIYGIGLNLKARVYYDNNIATKMVGDEVIPGAVISAIESNGISITYKGKTQFISITTTEHAQFKSFEKNKVEDSFPPELSGLARELNQPAKMY